MAPLTVKKTSQELLKLFERSMASLDKYRRNIIEVSFADGSHERMQGYIESKRELVVAILNKQMSVEFNKFHYLDDLLKKLSAYDDTEITPEYCSIASYKMFLDTSSVVFRLQTEVLELKARLITLKKEQLVKVSVAEMHDTYRKNALSKLKTILQSLKQAEESDEYVSNLVDNRRSFVYRIVSQYIKAFKENCGRGDDGPMPSSGLSPSLQNISLVGFLEAVAEHIYQQGMADQLNPPSPDALQRRLEAYIMPQIYEDALNVVLKAGSDHVIASQCSRLSHVSQVDIIANCKIHVKGPIPFIDAITQLRMLYFSVTASAKIQAILSTAQSICSTIEEEHPNTTIGGDDFLDVWVFVIIHANVRLIATALSFIGTYANPTLLQGETEYCYTVLRLACDYVKKLDPVTLTSRSNITRPTIPKARKIIYVVTGLRPEFVRPGRVPTNPEDPLARIQVLRSVWLTGYSAVMVKEWAISPSRPVIGVLYRTNDPNDRCLAHVCEIDLSPNRTPTPIERLELLCGLLLVPSSTLKSPLDSRCSENSRTPCGLHVSLCDEGTILCMASLTDVLIDPNNKCRLTLVLPPVSDPWASLPILWRNLNLQRMGCKVDDANLLDNNIAPRHCAAELYSAYGIAPSHTSIRIHSPTRTKSRPTHKSCALSTPNTNAAFSEHINIRSGAYTPVNRERTSNGVSSDSLSNILSGFSLTFLNTLAPTPTPGGTTSHSLPSPPPSHSPSPTHVHLPSEIEADALFCINRTIHELVCETQLLLRLLDHLSPLVSIDGLLSNAVMGAMQRFQQRYNEESRETHPYTMSSPLLRSIDKHRKLMSRQEEYVHTAGSSSEYNSIATPVKSTIQTYRRTVDASQRTYHNQCTNDTNDHTRLGIGNYRDAGKADEGARADPSSCAREVGISEIGLASRSELSMDSRTSLLLPAMPKTSKRQFSRPHLRVDGILDMPTLTALRNRVDMHARRLKSLGFSVMNIEHRTHHYRAVIGVVQSFQDRHHIREKRPGSFGTRTLQVMEEEYTMNVLRS
eukprot:CFRG0585T1